VDARDAFLAHHALIHAHNVAPDGMFSYEDLVVHLLLRGEPEIFDDGWSDRLGVDRRHAGTGFGDDEVSELSERVNVAALREYRATVGRTTRDWIAEIDLETLDHRPDVRGRIAADAATLGVRAAWVVDLWEGRTVHQLLLVPVLSHAFIHFGEVSVTRARLGGATR
jgi:hypothetical protein